MRLPYGGLFVGSSNKEDLWLYSRTASDEARHISKYETGDKKRKPAFVPMTRDFGGRSRSGEIGFAGLIGGGSNIERPVFNDGPFDVCRSGETRTHDL